jgi:hypothetical protein
MTSGKHGTLRTLAHRQHLPCIAAAIGLSGISLGLSMTAAVADPMPARGGSAAGRPAGELYGGIAKLGYLLGTWNCKDARSGQLGMVMTFTASEDNTIHEHDLGGDSEADEYFGYSPTAHSYYVALADTGGSYGYGVSTDGVSFSETVRAGLAINYKTTFSFQRLSSDTVGVHAETIVNGMKAGGESICSRQHES